MSHKVFIEIDDGGIISIDDSEITNDTTRYYNDGQVVRLKAFSVPCSEFQNWTGTNLGTPDIVQYGDHADSGNNFWRGYVFQVNTETKLKEIYCGATTNEFKWGLYQANVGLQSNPWESISIDKLLLSGDVPDVQPNISTGQGKVSDISTNPDLDSVTLDPNKYYVIAQGRDGGSGSHHRLENIDANKLMQESDNIDYWGPDPYNHFDDISIEPQHALRWSSGDVYHPVNNPLNDVSDTSINETDLTYRSFIQGNAQADENNDLVVVFTFDKSGSMQSTWLQETRDSINQFIDNAANDSEINMYYSVVDYSSTATIRTNGLVEATGSSYRADLDNTGGGTNFKSAITKSLEVIDSSDLDMSSFNSRTIIHTSDGVASFNSNDSTSVNGVTDTFKNHASNLNINHVYSLVIYRDDGNENMIEVSRIAHKDFQILPDDLSSGYYRTGIYSVNIDDVFEDIFYNIQSTRIYQTTEDTNDDTFQSISIDDQGFTKISDVLTEQEIIDNNPNMLVDTCEIVIEISGTSTGHDLSNFIFEPAGNKSSNEYRTSYNENIKEITAEFFNYDEGSAGSAFTAPDIVLEFDPHYSEGLLINDLDSDNTLMRINGDGELRAVYESNNVDITFDLNGSGFYDINYGDIYDKEVKKTFVCNEEITINAHDTFDQWHFSYWSGLHQDLDIHADSVTFQPKHDYFITAVFVNPNYSTEPASDIQANSMVLNGDVLIQNTGYIDYWFEYGTDPELIDYNSTEKQSLEQGNNSAIISNLDKDTDYYYRFIFEVNGKLYKGNILSQKTRSETLYTLNIINNGDGYLMHNALKLNEGHNIFNNGEQLEIKVKPGPGYKYKDKQITEYNSE